METAITLRAQGDGSESCSIHKENITVVRDDGGGHTIIITFPKGGDGLCFLETGVKQVVGIETLRAAVAAYSKRKNKTLCLHLKATMNEPDVIVARLHGFFLNKALEKFHGVLKLKLTLAFSQERSDGNTHSFLLHQDLDVTTPLIGLPVVDKKFESCVGKKEPFIEKTFSHPTHQLIKMLYGVAAEDVLSASAKVVFFCSEVAGQVASSKISRDFLPDFAIVASNGTELPCHKLFLAAQSEVLLTMIQSGLEESTSNKMKMEDISEEGVTAFLDFLYTRDLTRPAENCEIALDLIQLGHKYHIPDMESVMKKILLRKPKEAFDVVLALRLFLFARNLEGYQEVIRKTARVMKLKSKAMLDSQECLRIFNGNSAALELCYHLSQN